MAENQTISIVTGNPGKVRELEVMSLGRLKFQMLQLDLPEIQSLDLKEIVTDKLQRAYKEAATPVIVDDVSAELENLNGLPGPFIKFFDQRLDGKALLTLAGEENAKVTIRCVVGYYDGSKMLFGEGSVIGSVVSPRGENGFGFDPIIMPDGETRTMSEMTAEEKLAISHRGKCFP